MTKPMGSVYEQLNRTRLPGMWKKLKTVPPVKALLGLDGRIHKFRMLKIRLPLLYQRFARRPVNEKKVVFFEVRLPEMTNSFTLLYRELKDSGEFDVHVHYLRNTFVHRGRYDKNCKAFIRDIATAKYIITNEASDVLSCVKMRPETVVVQTWHGCGAFKKFGFSTAERIFGLDRKRMLRYPFYKNYTFVTISSPEVAWAYEEAMNLSHAEEVLKPVGISRTDVFFDPDFMDEAFAHLHAVMPESRGKKVILYAPTFRGRVADGQAPDKLDIPLFQKKLGDQYVLLIKHHPLVRVRPQIPQECRKFAMDVTEKMTIDDLLCVSDVCISDYSSLIFEYSLFERPMLFFAYDKAEYDDWRGFYYDYGEMTPGPVCTKNEEMIDYILHLDARFDKQRVVDFKYKFMRSCDGHATQRILSLMLGRPWEFHAKEPPKEVRVSIVMPVYNASAWISDTLSSLRSQTLQEIEIICVDDGSTDRSAAIIEKLAERDSRIRLIRQKNSYAGVARNNGLSYARGEYVIFLDADDLFDPQMLEKMYAQAKRTDADICVCNAQKLRMDTGAVVKVNVYLDQKMLPDQEVFSKKDMPGHIFAFASNVPWNKMLKRSFVQEHGLQFQPVRQANDAYFILLALFFAERITTVRERLVTYRVANSASLTGKNSDTVLCLCQAYLKAWETLCEQPEFTEKIKIGYRARFVRLMIYSLHIQSRLEAYRTLYYYLKNTAFPKLSAYDLPRTSYYIPWQYDACQNIRNMEMEKFLMWDMLRYDAAAEQKNARIFELKEKLKKEADKRPVTHIKRLAKKILGVKD